MNRLTSSRKISPALGLYNYSVALFSSENNSTRLERIKEKLDSLNTPHMPLTHQTLAGRKRFYKHVGVEKTHDHQYKITLDGRNLKTPGRNNLHLPTLELALGIAAEWDAQTDSRKGLEPTTMPLMTLASTAIDQISLDPETTIKTCMKYFPTDSALFHTEETDRILLKKQRTLLQPPIKWLSRQLRMEIPTTSGMTSRIQHPPEIVEAIEKLVSSMDHFTLACLQNATSECKSIVLALAFVGKYLTLEQVKAASRIEEEFQVEIWGVVEGGHDMDRLNNSVNLASVGVFNELLHQDRNIIELLLHKHK